MLLAFSVILSPPYSSSKDWIFGDGGEGLLSDGGSNLSLREEAAIFSDSGSILSIGL